MARRSSTTYGHPSPPPVAGKGFLEVGDGLFATVDDDVWHRAKDYVWSLNAKGDPHTKYKVSDEVWAKWSSITLKAFVAGVRAARGQAVKNLDGDQLNCCRSNVALMSLTDARALDRKNLGPIVRKPRRKDRMRVSNRTPEERAAERAEQAAARAAAKKSVTGLLG